MKLKDSKPKQHRETKELAEILNINAAKLPLDKTLMFYFDRYVIDIFKLEKMLGIDDEENRSTADIIRERYGDRAIDLILKYM